MTIQSATEVDVRMGWETTWGVTQPGIAMKRLNKVSCSLNGTTESRESNRIRSDRQTDDSGNGMISSAGDLSDELAVGDHDEMLEATVAGTWTPGASITGSVIISGDTISRVAGWGGFFAGDLITLAGTDSDGGYRIKSIVGGDMTVTDRDGAAVDLVDETVSATLAVQGYKLKNGKVKRSATFEIHKPDISGDQYEAFRGVRFGSATISLSPQGIATIRYSLMGRDWDINAAPIDGSIDDAPAGELMTAVQGTAFLDGEPLELLTNLEFSIENSLSGDGVVGSQYRSQLIYGRTKTSASFSALVDSDRFAKKHKARERFNLEIVLQAGDDFLRIALPSAKSQTLTCTVQGEGALTCSGELEGLRDPAQDAMVVLQKSNA